MKWPAGILVASFGTLFASDVLPLDNKRQALTVAGFTFLKSYDEAGRRWTFRAMDGSRVLQTFGSVESNELDDALHLSIGTARVVAGYGPEVIIRLWTGGKNCCNIYWIVGFTPKLRVLLDTTPYRFDDLETAGDIDGDGDVEFSFGTTTFDYFAAGHASSARAHAWFKFDRTSSAFLPANGLCFPEIEKTIRADEAKLRQHSARDAVAPENQEFRQIVLDIVLAYLYAGRQREAWSFFGSEYRQSDADNLKTNVERKVNSDPFFRAMNRRGLGQQ